MSQHLSRSCTDDACTRRHADLVGEQTCSDTFTPDDEPMVCQRPAGHDREHASGRWTWTQGTARKRAKPYLKEGAQ